MRRSLALLLLVLAGCQPTEVGSATPAATAHGDPTAVATTPPTPGASLPSQTDTEWGRIWDALPPWFPIPEGAKRTETGEEAFSAELLLRAGSTAEAAAEFFRARFQAAGFASVDVDGPIEDGGFVVSVPGDCQIEVRIAQRGDSAVASVRYGARCPFE